MAIQRSGTRLTWFIYHLTGRLNVQVWCRCFQIASICLRCFLLLLLCVSWLEHTTVLMPSTFSSSVYCITCMLVHIIGDTNKTGTRPLKQCLLVLHMKYHQIQLRCSDVTKWLKNTIKFIYIYIYIYIYIHPLSIPLILNRVEGVLEPIPAVTGRAAWYTQAQGEHADSTQKGPSQPVGSNPEPSC